MGLRTDVGITHQVRRWWGAVAHHFLLLGLAESLSLLCTPTGTADASLVLWAGQLEVGLGPART